MEAETSTPTIKWFQRRKNITIDVCLPQVKEETLHFDENAFDFVCESEGKKYKLHVELFDTIDPSRSSSQKSGDKFRILLQKKEQQKPYWKRLQKSQDKNKYITVNWDKWIDSQDEEYEQEGVLRQEQMVAMKGYPGMDEHSSSDESEEFEKQPQSDEKQQQEGEQQGQTRKQK